MNLNLEQRITRARMRMLVTQPFFGTILIRQKMVCDPSVKTMAVDGTNLIWAPDYVAKLPEPQLMGLLAHEVMHLALCHHLRRGVRNNHLWNLACDAAIDHILKDGGFDVPDSFADHSAWDWAKGLTAEAIYERLPRDQQSESRAGEVRDVPDKTQTEQEIKQWVQQAATAQKSKDKGNLPAWLKDLVTEICSPIIRWQDVLRDFVAKTKPSDFSWRRPNRRFLAAHNIYMPSRDKTGIGEVVLYFDTSGSCWSSAPQFFGEINAIMEDMAPEALHLILCDASVGSFTTYLPGEPLDPTRVGCGGSDFRPAFAEVEKRGIQPQVAIILSDMEIEFPSTPPSYPCIGISTTKTSGPDWMTNIRMRS